VRSGEAVIPPSLQRQWRKSEIFGEIAPGRIVSVDQSRRVDSGERQARSQRSSPARGGEPLGGAEWWRGPTCPPGTNQASEARAEAATRDELAGSGALAGAAEAACRPEVQASVSARPDHCRFRLSRPAADYRSGWGGHSFGDQPRRDAARDALILREGFRVLRVPAREVLRNMQGVIDAIVASCMEVGPLHRPLDGSPPRPGED